MTGAAGVLEWIGGQCQRAALRPDTIGSAIYDAADAAGVSEDDAALLIRSFLSAGVDTTVSALAYSVYDFIRFPDQWELVRDHPSLARNAVPGDGAAGVAGHGVLSHHQPRRGARPWPGSRPTRKVLGPLRRGQPGRATLGPGPTPTTSAGVWSGHLGYGIGPHVCVGMTIARIGRRGGAFAPWGRGSPPGS